MLRHGTHQRTPNAIAGRCDRRSSRWAIMEATMASRNRNRVPAYCAIDIEDPEEVRFWCHEFNIAPLDLLSVVLAVGPVVDDVKAELVRLAAAGLTPTQCAMR